MVCLEVGKLLSIRVLCNFVCTLQAFSGAAAFRNPCISCSLPEPAFALLRSHLCSHSKSANQVIPQGLHAKSIPCSLCWVLGICHTEELEEPLACHICHQLTRQPVRLCPLRLPLWGRGECLLEEEQELSSQDAVATDCLQKGQTRFHLRLLSDFKASYGFTEGSTRLHGAVLGARGLCLYLPKTFAVLFPSRGQSGVEQKNALAQ